METPSHTKAPMENVNLIYIFYSYAREDIHLRDKLEMHLSILKYRGLIATWHDCEIPAGKGWSEEINIHLEGAHIILLLISPSFMASDYCYSIEMKRAMERQQNNEALVIPIILRPVLWEGAPFAKLQMLPTNAKPVVSWRNRDDAFLDIARGIEKIVSGSSERRVLTRLEALLKAFVAPSSVATLSDKSRYYGQALIAYDQAILHDPKDVAAYNGKGDVLMLLKRHKEALTVYEQGLRLDPDSATAHHNRGTALKKLGRLTEAQQAFTTAKRLGYDK